MLCSLPGQRLMPIYVERVFQRFPEVRDSVDFCTYWFRLAQDNLKPHGRAGFVATNSIRHGVGRRASLDYIRDHGGHIHSAISTQPWSGEANVHVSIVNWSLRPPENCRLDGREVSTINTSLRSAVDVSEASTLEANRGYCFQGVIPVGKGFNVAPETAAAWIAADPKNAEVVIQFYMGSKLAHKPIGLPVRWIIDFNNLTLEEAEAYSAPFQQVKALVRTQRLENRREATRVNWWRYGEKRPAMRAALAPLEFYIAVPRVSKWAVFLPMERDWLPGDLNVVLASQDFYVLGILSSMIHRSWMQVQKSTLKADIRYTHDTIFETYPFPQVVKPELVEKIRQAMTVLNDYRNKVMVAKNCGITDLYNAYFHEPASQLAKLHRALDALVLKAYGWKAGEDILGNLLDLNQELAELEGAGEPVVGPWAPVEEGIGTEVAASPAATTVIAARPATPSN